MADEPEVIRHQMAETRASLDDKLEALEEKVVGTVEGATTAVSETVENVKEAVQETVTSVKENVSETVEGVKEAFDLRLQVERHPCLMTAAAVAAGYVAGTMLSRTNRHGEGWSDQHRSLPPEGSDGPASPHSARLAGQPGQDGGPATQQRTARLSAPRSSWADLLAPELAKARAIAFGYLMGVVRDVVCDSLPWDVRMQARETLDSITEKLGGLPVRGRVLGNARRVSGFGECGSRPNERP
ncbi:MAG TPA: YtxH domain-containing protein [Gemmataceae bacterium]|nr:YtxH domain-containing protein [Gemmataceae bacterium]